MQQFFFGFFELFKTDGSYLFVLVQSILTEYTIYISKIFAQCYDGAANMCGSYKGVSTRFKEICRRAFYIYCNGYILNLVLIDAAKSITTSRNTFGTIAQLHNSIKDLQRNTRCLKPFKEKE